MCILKVPLLPLSCAICIFFISLSLSLSHFFECRFTFGALVLVSVLFYLSFSFICSLTFGVLFIIILVLFYRSFFLSFFLSNVHGKWPLCFSTFRLPFFLSFKCTPLVGHLSLFKSLFLSSLSLSLFFPPDQKSLIVFPHNFQLNDFTRFTFQYDFNYLFLSFSF